MAVYRDAEGGETKPLVNKSTKETVTKRPTVWDDCIDTIQLGVPIFISMLSWVGVRATMREFQIEERNNTRGGNKEGEKNFFGFLQNVSNTIFLPFSGGISFFVSSHA